MMMTECVWQLDAVGLVTDGVQRLRDVSLAIGSGRTAVLGFSGAGKSSLLSLLAEMERPSSGAVRLDSEVVACRGKLPDRGKSLPQEFDLPLYWAPQGHGLWPHLTAGQHVEAVLGANGKMVSSADKWLNQFDLEERWDAFPDQLSAGEQSRLAVVRALAANPAVLVMDEPLTHVDGARRSGYWRVIDDWLKLTGAAFVFSTHEPATALLQADDVVCLQDGECVFAGSTLELYQRPESKKLAEFLGPVNWLDDDEWTFWLPGEVRRSLRPEQLRLDVADGGSCEILSFRFAGGYAETQVRRGDRERWFVHRPSGLLAVGDRVEISMV